MIIEKLNVHCDRLLSHHQLACCRNYCGIPMRGKEVFVYNNDPKGLEVCSIVTFENHL